MNRKYKILLIEDNPADARFLKEILVDSGIDFRLSNCSRLSDGLTALEEENYDVLLLDLSLPDSHGISGIEKIHQHNRHIPVIILTGLDDEKVALHALQEGAQDFLVKGQVEPDILKRSIRYSIERKKVDQELSRKDSLLLSQRQAMDHFLFVIEFDENGEMTYVNQHFLSDSKYKSDELLGQHYRILKFKIEPMEIFLEFKENLKKYEEWQGELSWQDANGNLQWAYVAITPVLDEGRKLESYVCLGLDISHRKKIETMKDEFIGSVSHEIRTPLTLIKSAISNLQAGIVGALSPEQDHVVGIAYRNCDRLARIINDILDLSRLESGNASIRCELLSLKEILSDNIEEYSELCEQKGIELKVDFPDGLAQILADADLINQVFWNLLNNALRFTKSYILVRAQEEETFVILSIIDDGEGIAAEDQMYLFDKFLQVNRPSGGAGYKGTGLGLAIVKEILKRIGGKIVVESEKGQGAQFHCYIPKRRMNEQR